MQFLKSRLSLRDVSMWLGCLAAILGIVSAIVYPLTAANEFNLEISVQLVVMLVVAAVVELASLIFRFKEVRAIAFFLFVYDLIIYGGTQGNYLANLLVSIDNHTPSASLVSMFTFLIVAVLASLLSMILLKEKKPEAAQAAPKGE